MKKLAIIIAAAAMVASCAPKAKVSGCLQGIENDFILCMYDSDAGSGTESLDTVKIDKGKFQYNPPVDETGVLLIVDIDNFVDFIELYLVPGENAVLNGRMTNYTVGGSKFYRDMGEFKKLTADVDARKTDLFHRLAACGDNEPDFDFHGEENEIGKEKDELAIEYITANPDKDFSAYLATEVGISRFEEAYNLLGESAKSGKLAGKLENTMLALSSDEIRRQAMGLITTGAEAPDFTLKDSKGGMFTLSEQRGKWVLLDFWGTWCHWCCEGIPNVRKVSETYADCLQVVSVDTGDPESKWLEGIQEFGMTWTQVYNSKADAVHSKYAVEGFPGFYLIDPDGIIRMISFGEPYDFVETIGEYVR